MLAFCWLGHCSLNQTWACTALKHQDCKQKKVWYEKGMAFWPTNTAMENHWESIISRVVPVCLVLPVQLFLNTFGNFIALLEIYLLSNFTELLHKSGVNESNLSHPRPELIWRDSPKSSFNSGVECAVIKLPRWMRTLNPSSLRVLRGFACVLYKSTPVLQKTTQALIFNHISVSRCRLILYIPYQNEATLEVNAQFHVLNQWHIVFPLSWWACGGYGQSWSGGVPFCPRYPHSMRRCAASWGW